MIDARASLFVVAVLSSLPLLSGCDFAAPFEGPGYVPGEGLTTDAPGPFVVSTTWLVVKDGDGNQQAFDGHMEKLGKALETQEGLVGKSLSLPLGVVGYRTLSVWESEEAVLDWVVSDVHSAAMSDMADRAADGAVTSWSMTRAELEEAPPSWDDARARLDEDGRSVY